MNDPYLYPQTGILKNLVGIQNSEELSQMEAEYTSLRLAELVMMKSASRFDFSTLRNMHYYIFQDIFEWAGKIRRQCEIMPVNKGVSHEKIIIW